MFRRIVFKNPDYEFKARSLKVKSTGPLEKKVEKTVMALGMDGISSAKKKNVKFLSIDGVAPTKENLAVGKYPLFRPLYLATNTNTNPDAQKVLDFVLSDEGQAIISAQGTVNLQEGKALEPLWEAKKTDMGL
jgi:phosphate transport system substrate-binding protein